MYKKISFLVICLIVPFITEHLTHAQHKNVVQEIITNPANSEKIEFFTLKPRGEGPFPVLFLLHGFQPPENSSGGKQLVEYGYLDRFVTEGLVAVSISMPGYGNSTGRRDFGGPDSQKAILAVIDHFKTLNYIDSSKIGIYGISRGAQLAGMVSSCSTDISLQILESGFYDLISFLSETPEYLNGIKKGIVIEGGNSFEALIERSPLYHVETTTAVTLILQGEFDDRRQLPAARNLHKNLLNCGTESHLKIFLDEVHALPANKWDAIIPFIRHHFLQLYGIGIKITDATPAIQILTIHPDSPASRCGKLKIGDAILSISPINNETEISTLRMSKVEFIRLMLGKKNTSLRLYVQHFDLSFEEIILERG